MNLRDFLNKNAAGKTNGATSPANGGPSTDLSAIAKQAEMPGSPAPSLRQAVNRFARPGAKPQVAAPIPQPAPTKPPVVDALIPQMKPPAAIVAPREALPAEIVSSDLSKATVDDLRTSLVFLAEHIEHKELVGQVVRRIAQMLIINPQFSTQMPMERKDFNLLVRGLRRSYNVAARKKSEKSEEKQRKGAEKALNISELENLLDSF